MNDITINVEPTVMAGALKYLLFLIPVVRAGEMGTGRVKNDELLPVLGHDPGPFAQRADVPAITESLVVGHKGGLTYGNEAGGGDGGQ